MRKRYLCPRHLACGILLQQQTQTENRENTTTVQFKRLINNESDLLLNFELISKKLKKEVDKNVRGIPDNPSKDVV